MVIYSLSLFLSLAFGVLGSKSPASSAGFVHKNLVTFAPPGSRIKRIKRGVVVCRRL
jgi:hypothetical protein